MTKLQQCVQFALLALQHIFLQNDTFHCHRLGMKKSRINDRSLASTAEQLLLVPLQFRSTFPLHSSRHGLLCSAKLNADWIIIAWLDRFKPMQWLRIISLILSVLSVNLINQLPFVSDEEIPFSLSKIEIVFISLSVVKRIGAINLFDNALCTLPCVKLQTLVAYKLMTHGSLIWTKIEYGLSEMNTVLSAEDYEDGTFGSKIHSFHFKFRPTQAWVLPSLYCLFTTMKRTIEGKELGPTWRKIMDKKKTKL